MCKGAAQAVMTITYVVHIPEYLLRNTLESSCSGSANNGQGETKRRQQAGGVLHTSTLAEKQPIVTTCCTLPYTGMFSP